MDTIIIICLYILPLKCDMDYHNKSNRFEQLFTQADSIFDNSHQHLYIEMKKASKEAAESVRNRNKLYIIKHD